MRTDNPPPPVQIFSRRAPPNPHPLSCRADYTAACDRTDIFSVKQGERLGLVGMMPAEGGGDSDWAIVVRTSGDHEDAGPGYCPTSVVKRLPQVDVLATHTGIKDGEITLYAEQRVWLFPGDGEHARVLAIDGACGLVPRVKLSKPPGADKPKAKPRPPMQRQGSFAHEDLRETTRKVIPRRFPGG